VRIVLRVSAPKLLAAGRSRCSRIRGRSSAHRPIFYQPRKTILRVVCRAKLQGRRVQGSGRRVQVSGFSVQGLPLPLRAQKCCSSTVVQFVLGGTVPCRQRTSEPCQSRQSRGVSHPEAGFGRHCSGVLARRQHPAPLRRLFSCVFIWGLRIPLFFFRLDPRPF